MHYYKAWIEMHEYDIMTYRIPDDLDLTKTNLFLPRTMSFAELQQANEKTSQFMAPYQWYHTISKLAAPKGINVRAGHDLPMMLEAAGLQDVQITRYIVPLGMWKAGGLSLAQQKMASQNRGFLQYLVPMLLRKLHRESGTEMVTEAEVERAAQSSIDRTVDWDADREFIYLYVVYGRKVV